MPLSPHTGGVFPHRPSIPHTTSVHCLSFRTRFYALSGGIASRDSEFDVLNLDRGASLLRVGVIEAGQYLPEDPLINVPTA